MQEAIDPAQLGLLADHIEPLCGELLAAGWRPATVASHRRLLHKLSRWAAEAHPDGLSEQVVEEFFRLRREAGCSVRFSTTGMAPVLERLRARGAVVGAAPPANHVDKPIGGGDPLLADYVRHMRVERCLAESTVVTRLDIARRFAATIGPDLGRLRTDDVSGFLLGEVRRLQPSGAAKVGDGVRAFLRFLFAAGVLEKDLSGLALTVRQTAGGAAEDNRARDGRGDGGELRPREPDRPAGLRVLTLLVRLGLRAAEVSAVALEDIDWDAGGAVVHGKGRRERAAPAARRRRRGGRRLPRRRAPTGRARAVFVNLASHCGEAMTAQSVSRVRCAPPGAPGWSGSAPTACATPPPPGCSVPARRCGRSPRCCAMQARRRPPSMPRSIAPPSIAACRPGPGADGERAARGARRLPGDAPRPRLPPRATGACSTHSSASSRPAASSTSQASWRSTSRIVPRAEAAKRLSAIRIFARYRCLLPAVVERKAPHLYSDEELAVGRHGFPCLTHVSVT